MMSHMTAIKEHLTYVHSSILQIFLIFCIIKWSIPAHHCTATHWSLCSSAVFSYNSQVLCPILYCSAQVPSLGKQNLSVNRWWGNSCFLSLQLLLSPCPGANCRFQFAEAELWNHALPQSIYRRMSTLPRNSALDPSLCHASHFLVGYKLSEIPAAAPHWKGQLLHY